MEGWVTERTEGRRGCSAAGLGHGFPGGADWPSAEPQNGQKRRPATHSFSTSTSTPSSRCVCVLLSGFVAAAICTLLLLPPASGLRLAH